MNTTRQHPVTVYDHQGRVTHREQRTLVDESPLVIGVNGTADYTIMRTPGNDRELAVGFLFTEGLIDRISDIMMLRECPDTPHAMAVKTATAGAEAAKRNMVINSSCGLCGRADMEALVATLGRVTAGISLPHLTLFNLSRRVSAEQQLFKVTGATHAAALFDTAGNIFALREDIGRHNAMDKVVGSALLRGAATAQMGVFLSGRTSLELIIKAARAGITVMVSVSAPTQAAVTMADRLGITLVGFARQAGFTVYTHPDRIDFTGSVRETGSDLPLTDGLATAAEPLAA